MSKAVFQRSEIKYIITPEQKARLLKSLNMYIKPDEYPKYTICNIYYDTPDYSLIRSSIEKPIYKEKLRLRSYGVPNADSPAFLEIKKKFKGVVSKRRIEKPLGQLEAYLNNGNTTCVNTQIGNEINYFLNYFCVEPKVYIAYDREAYSGKDCGDLRITFDSDIRFRFTALDLKCGDYGTSLTNPDCIILEIKVTGSMPLWLSGALTEQCIYPGTFSKYGTIYKKYIGGNEKCLIQSLPMAL